MGVVGETRLEPGTRVERVYREEGARLWRAILALTRDPEIASDAVAEAFAQLLRRGDEVRTPERWVWRVAFRLAAAELKARRKRLEHTWREEAQTMDTETVELVEALARLPLKQRASVVLHHGAGYPVSAIASIIDSTPAAVRVHLSRGRRRLRVLLGGNDV